LSFRSASHNAGPEHVEIASFAPGKESAGVSSAVVRSHEAPKLRLLRVFLRRFVLISLAFFGVLQASLYRDALHDYLDRTDSTEEAARQACELVTQTLASYTADLRILALSESVRRLAAQEPGASGEVTRDFVRFVRFKQVVAQLRYLDRKGDEIVRIDRSNERIIIVPPSALQNKSDRYYFQQASGLPPAILYISPIDLNIENGRVDVPWKPMLRLALTVGDPRGQSAGVVIVNIAADELIAAAKRAMSSKSEALELLNEEGYLLAGAPSERLWGFMFGRRDSLAINNPELWSRIRARARGTWDSPAVRYVYQTIRPDAFVSADAHGSGIRATSVQWTIVGAVPMVSAATLWGHTPRPAAVLGLLLIAGICIAWSKATLGRQTADEQKKTAETELVRVERLASLGGLVAGVAHELNTPIGNAVTLASALASHTQELNAKLETDQIKRSTLSNYVADMREGTFLLLEGLERAAQLVGHFKQIAVDHTSEQRRTYRVTDVVENVLAALRPQFKHGNIELRCSIETERVLDGFPGPLGQVFMNLIENARLHAFGTGDAGKIEIIARDAQHNETEIIVADNGSGIPADQLPRIFEPFFTTRMGHGGSGLGLSIVSNIVTDMLGGSLNVDSIVGEGTRMIIRLPDVAPVRAQHRSWSAFDARAQRTAG
jgi:two-component system NtrC family sensor kinase